MYLSRIFLLSITLCFLCDATLAKDSPPNTDSIAGSAFVEWDNAQAEATKRFNDSDHQTCVNAGFTPRSWGNPDTEKYYSCRARLVLERAPALPAGVTKAALPRAAVFFQQKAHEAQYAFRVIDEQSHQTCLEKGGMPGEMDDPKTKLYYECRAKLAEEQMGLKIALLFRQKATEAASEAADAEICTKQGLKKEDPGYSQCKEKVTASRQCLNNIQSKLEQKTKQNAIDCQEEAQLKLPDQLAKGHGRAYTAAQLTNARQKMTGICLRERKDMMGQYAAGLKLECKDNMSQ